MCVAGQWGGGGRCVWGTGRVVFRTYAVHQTASNDTNQLNDFFVPKYKKNLNLSLTASIFHPYLYDGDDDGGGGVVIQDG